MSGRTKFIIVFTNWQQQQTNKQTITKKKRFHDFIIHNFACACVYKYSSSMTFTSNENGMKRIILL